MHFRNKRYQRSARSVFYDDLLGAGLMIAVGVTALVWGVAAEGTSLEAIAQPLSAVKAAGRLAPKVPCADVASAEWWVVGCEVWVLSS